MRGVLKRHGSLPHLSNVGDVRTADVLVQAAYLAQSSDPAEGDPPIESGASLSMSPTTGAQVTRVTNDFLEQLLRRHEAEIVFLGHIYRSDAVRLPMTIRHFGPANVGGAGEAYHTGIFGMTGSGKSAFASYLLAAQLRHTEMAVVIMDPQGQFTSEEGLPFSLQEWAESIGRPVRLYSISSDLRLDQEADLLGDLLGLTRFFADLLTIKAEPNRESAVAEFTRILRATTNWSQIAADTLLQQLTSTLANDAQAIQRIYSSPQAQARLVNALSAITPGTNEFTIAAEIFRPLHSLFAPTNPQGGNRRSIHSVLQELLATGDGARPLLIIDFSSAQAGATDILNSTPVKAAILRRVCSRLNLRAEEQFRQGHGNLNTLVVFDEAQRFAAESPEDEESEILANKLVDYVRTTRKYGLGWAFITQEVSSLRRGIYSQLRVRCFGYGLTSGTELQRLRDTIGDPAALDLYRSFVDPAAIQPSEYPFMLTGPISPLSFTGVPVFLSVYTDFDTFRADNNLAT